MSDCESNLHAWPACKEHEPLFISQSAGFTGFLWLAYWTTYNNQFHIDQFDNIHINNIHIHIVHRFIKKYG